MQSVRRPARVIAVATIALVLAGCDPDAREDIADAIDDAVSDAQSAIDGGTTAPTTDPTADPTTEPTTSEPSMTEPAAEPPAPAETTAVATDEPTGEPTELPVEEGVVEDDPNWPLLLALGGILLLLVWAFVAVWRRRQALLARRARLRDAALADVDWLLGAAREQPSSIDAAARARDVRLRQDRLNDTVTQLRAGASAQLVALTTAVSTSSRHLADALVARLDDVAARRAARGADLGVPELAERLRMARDDLASELGRRPEQS